MIISVTADKCPNVKYHVKIKSSAFPENFEKQNNGNWPKNFYFLEFKKQKLT